MDGDHITRAITNDYAFRLIVARTTDTVSEVVEKQQLTDESALRLAELVTATILVRETMAPTLRVQGILKAADGVGTLVANSEPTGGACGLAKLPESSNAFSARQGAILQMLRSLPNGDLQQGVVELPPDSGVSGALSVYMENSEQIASIAAVGCRGEGDQVDTAGGFLIQLLPEAPNGALERARARVEKLGNIEQLLDRTGGDPQRMAKKLLGSDLYTQLAESPLQFECRCSEERVMGGLASLPRSDVRELVNDGKVIEIGCDFCGSTYRIGADRLKGLLETA